MFYLASGPAPYQRGSGPCRTSGGFELTAVLGNGVRRRRVGAQLGVATTI